MRHILKIAFIGHAWGGFTGVGSETTYPIEALTQGEAVALRDSLIATKGGKVEGKLTIVGMAGDYESLIDVSIEQITWDFDETFTADGRRVTTEVKRTEAMADWSLEGSEDTYSDATHEE